MRGYFFLIVASSLLPCLLCIELPDPLCAAMSCPVGQRCRAIKPCGRKDKCNIIVACIPDYVPPKQDPTPPTWIGGEPTLVGSAGQATSERKAGCKIGYPVLLGADGRQGLLTCYGESPCPENGYCSTALLDASSVCCRADPVQRVKPGTCRPPDPNVDKFFCVDQCRSDSDCDFEEKCCYDGCSKRCSPPNLDLPIPHTNNDHVVALARQCDDPCAEMTCKPNEVCRPYKPCGRFETCDVQHKCIAKKANHNPCKCGTPVVHEEEGTMQDLTCYSESPCPTNAYCNTELLGASSVCCFSDPARTVKAGTCPSVQPDPTRFFRVDQCKSDGDCNFDHKCCNTGHSLECVPPAPPMTRPPPPTPMPLTDPCDNTECPVMTYCRRIQSCHSVQNCRLEEECVPCAIVQPRPGYKVIPGPDGCPAEVPKEQEDCLHGIICTIFYVVTQAVKDAQDITRCCFLGYTMHMDSNREICHCRY